MLRKHAEISSEIYPLENLDFEFIELEIYSAVSAVWILNRMDPSIFLGKDEPTALENTILVGICFSWVDFFQIEKPFF